MNNIFFIPLKPKREMLRIMILDINFMIFQTLSPTSVSMEIHIVDGISIDGENNFHQYQIY